MQMRLAYLRDEAVTFMLVDDGVLDTPCIESLD